MVISCFVKCGSLIYIKVFVFIFYCEQPKLRSFVLPCIMRLSVLIDLNETKIVAFYSSIIPTLFLWFLEVNTQVKDTEAMCKAHYL